MHFLTYLHKYDSHARILTNRNGFVFCYIRIFGKLTEYFLSYFRLFGLFGIFQGAVNVVVQYAVCLYTKLRHSFRYGVYRYFSHYKGSPSAKLSFIKKHRIHKSVPDCVSKPIRIFSPIEKPHTAFQLYGARFFIPCFLLPLYLLHLFWQYPQR